MSANCLITTLNGVVNAPDVYKINEVRMFIPAGNRLRLDAAYRDTTEQLSFTPLSGSLISGGTTYAVGETLNITGNSNYTISTPDDADAVWSISNKNAFKRIYFNRGERVSPISGKHRQILNPDFGYWKNLEYMETYMRYDLDNLMIGKFPKLKEWGTATYYQGLPATSIQYITPNNFPVIELCKFDIFGGMVDIKTFASLTTLTHLYAIGSAYCGSIEEFADAMLSAGRTGGSIAILTDRNVTYQGQVWENRTFTITFSGNSYTIQ